MIIQIDSREKERAIQKILAEFEKSGINHFISKLYVGDYMSYDNPRIVVDRKQNLSELCSNVCQNHDRFRNELVRANEHGIKLIFLCEHGNGVKTIEDVIFWQNPRGKKRFLDKEEHRWKEVKTKAMTGETLYKILTTLEEKYNCKFLFCNKNETGSMIIRILGGEYDS